jgi:glucosyl-dolichyl phosphate glucuronosyltransferase
MALDATVIVCTRNRARRLRAMLDSACGLSVPAGLGWELLVVDNGSSDGSADVARRFSDRLPLRLVDEPVAGLCLARNRGVAEAQGRYMIWTDDDVLLDPGWLCAYAEAFRRHPEAAVFGGRILPVLEPPAPAWFERSLHAWPISSVVAYRDMGDRESMIALEDGRMPWGANFAVRAAEQKRHLYNLEIGFSPHHKRTGEETDVIYRILKAGGSGWWVPASIVRHVIPAERQTRAYVVDFFDQAGRTVAFLHDRFPGANAVAVHGPPPLARLGPSVLRLAAAAAGLVSAAARFAGLHGPSLRFLARRGYYLGLAAHRRGSRAQPVREQVELPRTEKAC